MLKKEGRFHNHQLLIGNLNLCLSHSRCECCRLPDVCCYLTALHHTETMQNAARALGEEEEGASEKAKSEIYGTKRQNKEEVGAVTKP